MSHDDAGAPPLPKGTDSMLEGPESSLQPAPAGPEATQSRADGGELPLSFKVRSSSDKIHTLSMVPSATVLQLKTLLAEDLYEGVPVERQRLIYSGRVLKNDDTIATYNIKPGNIVHLVRSAASNPQPATPSQPGLSTSSATRSPVPPNMAAGTANNLLAGLTGARYAGHVHLPSRDMFGPDGGLGPPADPEEMMRMLQDPAYRQTMNDFLDNPDFVNMLIDSNPMLRSIPNAREMFRTPFIRNMLTSPETFNAIRGLQGPSGAAMAFPAPGATDTTPAGAPATDPNAPATTSGPPAPSAGGIPNLFQLFNPAGAAGGGENTANNPFLPLFNALQVIPQAQQGVGSTGVGPAGNAETAAGNPMQAMTPAVYQAINNMLTGMAANNPSPGQAANVQGSMDPMMANQWGSNPLFRQMIADHAQTAAAPVDNRPPEERYEVQLRQLNEMGFYDFDRNVAALRRSGGNVQGAIDFLLGGF